MLLLLIIYITYLKRNWLKKVWDSLSDRYGKRLAKFLTPLNSVIISAGLFLFAFLFLHPVWAKVLFPILLAALIYFGVHSLRRRKAEKEKEKQTGVQE